MFKSHIFGMTLLAALPLAAYETNTWSCETVGNTPLTALDWSDAGNWALGHVPAAGDCVKWNKPDGVQYVRLPDALTVNQLNGANPAKTIFIGESLSIQSGNGGNGGKLSYGTLYADMSQLAGGTGCLMANVAGRISALAGSITLTGGWLNHRLDYYATSGDAVRTDDLSVGADYAIIPGDAHFAVYAAGAEASSSAWTLTEGSPYVALKDASAGYVAVGAAVTGEGVPAGTWVRRRFSNALLELSQPATATIDSSALSFSAFHPDARLHVTNFQRLGYDGSAIKLGRRMAADSLRFEIDVFENAANKDGNYWLLGLEASNLAEWQPGTFVLHEVRDAHDLRPSDRLRNCHIEFAGTADGGATAFGEKRIVAFDEGTADATARLTVPEGKSGAIANFTGFTGTVVKDGAGTLTIGLADAANAGSLAVEAGTLALTARASAGADGVSFASLALAAGATIQLPAEGMRVASATFGDGVTVRGPGVLRVAGAKTGRVTCADGARVVYEVGAVAADGYVHNPAAQVAGHPAFWVDASKVDSLVLRDNDDGTKSVMRWNDCRADETMFCTNVVKAPTYVSDGTPAGTYVKIGYEKTNWYTNTQGLVWSQPIRDIRAVFLVQDPTDGGGEILGRTSRLPDDYYGSQGGPYYGLGRSTWSQPLIGQNTTPCVRYGRFFLNGTEVYGHTSGYLGAFMQLLEHHVNTSKRAGTASETLVCDAFGTGGYRDGHSQNNANGRQRIAECIVYTNTLTYAERVQTALYLSRKWLGRDIAYSEFDEPLDGSADRSANLALAEGESVAVAAGSAGGARRAEGGASLVKDGAGLFVVDSLVAGDVTVNAGELRVKSFSLASDSVPTGAWVHVDASDDASFELNEDGAVAKWRNLAEEKIEYRPLKGTPKRVANALNGLPVVDCGVMNGDDKGSLILHDSATGARRYQHNNSRDDGFIAGAPYFASTFVVFGSQGGGNALLGCWGNGYPFQGLAHNPLDTANEKTLFMAKIGTNAAWDSSQVQTFTSGANVARLNGSEIDPFATKFSGGYDLLSVTTKDVNRKSDTLAIYGQVDTCVGGLSYGEVLVYSNALDAATLPKVEAYLRKKWFGVDTPGYLQASCGALRVAAGAVLTVGDWAAAQGDDAYGMGTGALAATGLGGGGTVRGDVALAADGVFAATAADGAIETLTVEGALTLPGACTVRVSDDAARLPPGCYTLVTATSIVGADDVAWKVEAPEKPRRNYAVRVQENSVTLTISAPGLLIILR